jgi:hypothetical protein
MKSNRETARSLEFEESNGHHRLSTENELLIAVSTHTYTCTQRAFRGLEDDRQPEVHEYTLSFV